MIVSTAGIVRRGSRYLVALRKPGTSIGTRWEFPGGKAEEGETPREALAREFMEELSLSVEVGELLFQGEFENRRNTYSLMAFEVTLLNGDREITLTEHSEFRWADTDELKTLSFPPSDGLIRDFLIEKESKG